MNGVLFRFRRQKNSTWIPAKLVLTFINSTGTKLSQFEVPKLIRTVSDLSTGAADIISEFYLYLLRVSGQRKFCKISFTSPSEPPDLLGRAAEISDLLKPCNRIFGIIPIFVHCNPCAHGGFSLLLVVVSPSCREKSITRT